MTRHFCIKRRAVAFVEGEVLVGMVELVAEQLRSPAQLADQLLGIGIDQQLVGIEAMAGVRLDRVRGRGSRRPCRGARVGR